jgi:hypothetical protein
LAAGILGSLHSAADCWLAISRCWVFSLFFPHLNPINLIKQRRPPDFCACLRWAAAFNLLPQQRLPAIPFAKDKTNNNNGIAVAESAAAAAVS